MYYCYVITNGKRTYNGFTNNLLRRLRQHNGELIGGARATSGKGPWRYVCVLTCETWTPQAALSMEWHIKYPTNKRPRPKHYEGPQGRLQSLPLAIFNSKKPHAEYFLYVSEEYAAAIPPLPDNVLIMDMETLILPTEIQLPS